MQREDALDLMTRHVAERGLRRHMLAVEAAMRWYGAQLGEDADAWGLAGLLHDFDWEIHPTLEQHPRDGAPILREAGCPEPVVQAILSHNTAGTGVERRTAMDFGLLACDEITGLITASALVRPDKDVREVRLKSLKKKWKDKAFARGVDRPHVAAATEDFSRACFDGGLELWQHVENVTTAMGGVAAELDLDGRLA
ncbi:MAG: HDIG domain-containing protein [Thermoanaerobaculia bacterium]|nr:HDIG domain-containing protein [Thermoanaerobaculia bacterium]